MLPPAAPACLASLQSKLAAVPTVRCEQCKACLRPSLHKPCHAPVPSEGQPQAADPK